MKTVSRNFAMMRFLLIFAGLVAGFTSLLQVPAINTYIIVPYVEAITYVSGGVYSLIDSSVETSKTVIRHADFAVNIKKGCDGIVASVILTSACLAFPASLKRKLTGSIQGFVLIFFLNQIRILILFSLGVLGRMDLFYLVHTYVAQFFIIACSMVFWLYWAGKAETAFPK